MIYLKKQSLEEVEYFTKKEAEGMGLSFIPWREAREAGQWVLTDDNYVIQTKLVKYITELHGRKLRTRYRVNVHLAIRYSHGKDPLILADHLKARSYGYEAIPWWVEFDRRFPAVRPALAREVLLGKLHMGSSRRYTRHEYNVLIRLAKKYFDPGKSVGKGKNWYHLRTFYSHEEVRQMIRKDIAEKAEKRGYTVDKVFDLLDLVEKIGKEKQDAKILLALARDMAGIIGIRQALSAPDPNRGMGEDLPGQEDHFDTIIERNKLKGAELATVVPEES